VDNGKMEQYYKKPLLFSCLIILVNYALYKGRTSPK
jgi:hypothetical protein